MFKRMTLCLVLILCALLLCACQSEQDTGKRFDVVTNPNDMQPQSQVQQPATVEMPTLSTEPQGSDDWYEWGDGDAAGDEFDWYEWEAAEDEADYANAGLSTEPTAAPLITSEYAGATPVVIDPIDKPTPTPLPELTFQYATYDAPKVHLSFDAPAGWEVVDDMADMFTIIDKRTPSDYNAMLTIRVTTVPAQMTETEMKAEVKNMMSTLRTTYPEFSATNTASRTLLDKNGVYANYTAVTHDGAQVAGRVHVTCIGKKMYMLHVSYPRGYTETYKTHLYDKFRHSVKITQ